MSVSSTPKPGPSPVLPEPTRSTSRPGHRPFPLPSRGALWVYVLLSLLFATLSLQPIYQPDFWWHVKVGEIVLQERAIPQADLFSYTVPGRPFIYQSWLAGVFLALLYQAGGAGLVILGNTVLLTAAYALLLWHCRAESGNTRLAAAATLAALVVSAGNWAVRPQTFSVGLFVVLYVIVDRFRNGKKGPLWLLPVLLVLWANLHGAFVTGLAVLWIVLAAEVGKRWLPRRPFPVMAWRRLGWLALAALLSSAAPMLNPVGPRIWSYVLGIWSNPAIRNLIAEWQPVSTEAGTSAIFILALLAVPLLAALRRRLPDPTDMLLLAATAWLAIGAVRNLMWFGLVLAPALARAGKRSAALEQASAQSGSAPAPAEPPPIPALHIAILATAALLIVLSLPWVKGYLLIPENLRGLYAVDTPISTAEAILEQDLPGPLFHQMESGSYLLWRLYPRYRVFIDPRIELYPDEVWQEYLDLSAGRPNYQEVLDRYGIRLLLLNRAHQAGLVEQVQDSPQWEKVYENAQENTVVYRRKP